MPRPTTVVVITFFLALVIFGLGIFMSRPRDNNGLVGSESVLRGESKSDNGEGDVTVMADFVERAGKLVFNVYVDTHTVDLSSFNPSAQISLESDRGAAVAPENVESSGSSHHLEFTLYFPKVEGDIRLIVRNLADVPRREILWSR